MVAPWCSNGKTAGAAGDFIKGHGRRGSAAPRRCLACATLIHRARINWHSRPMNQDSSAVGARLVRIIYGLAARRSGCVQKNTLIQCDEGKARLMLPVGYKRAETLGRLVERIFSTIVFLK